MKTLIKNEAYEEIIKLLLSNGYFCSHQVPAPPDTHYEFLEFWQSVKYGRFVIIQKWSRGNGYDYYLQGLKGETPKVLEDILARNGIVYE